MVSTAACPVGWGSLTEASTSPIPGPAHLRGGASLDVRFAVPAYDDNGVATYSPTVASEAVLVAGSQTLRQVAFVGSFEGVSQFGIGVRARLPFQVFILNGPGGGSRLVVDIAHSW